MRFYLFLGPDEAQSRALATRLLEALGAQKFVVPMSAVKANPALLTDEAAALSLFGERRLIWVEPAGNDLAEGAEALLEAEAIESPVAAIAGVLTKSSALLKLAESSPKALAFTAYLPDGDDAARLVADLGRRVGLKVSMPDGWDMWLYKDERGKKTTIDTLREKLRMSTEQDQANNET